MNFDISTEPVGDGAYVIAVTARDIRGNRGSLSQRFEVLNGQRKG